MSDAADFSLPQAQQEAFHNFSASVVSRAFSGEAWAEITKPLANLSAVYESLMPLFSEGKSLAEMVTSNLSPGLLAMADYVSIVRNVVPMIKIDEEAWAAFSVHLDLDTGGISAAIREFQTQIGLAVRIGAHPVVPLVVDAISLRGDLGLEEAELDTVITTAIVGMSASDKWLIATFVASVAISYYVWACVVFPDFMAIAPDGLGYFVGVCTLVYNKLDS